MRSRTAFVASLFVTLTACSRYAQVRPAEIPKVSGKLDDSVSVNLKDGGHVAIRRNFTKVIIVSRSDGETRTDVFRAPFLAEYRGETLYVWSAKHPTPIGYEPGQIESAEIAQYDGSRTMPLWLGLTIGGLAGAVAGALAGKDCPSTTTGHDPSSLCIGRGGSAVVGGLLGGGIGAVISIPFMADLKYYDKDDE